MFRQPTQEEYDYILPYLKGAENDAAKNVGKSMFPLKMCAYICVIIGIILIFFAFPISLFLWFTAWRLFYADSHLKKNAYNQVNQVNNYLFEIMDCTLLDIFFRKNDPNLPKGVLNVEPMANVLMSNGVKIPTYFIQTTESNAMGITNFDSNYEYNVSAYYIKLVNSSRNYVIVKP